jgi:hypothetical protein
MSARRTEGVVRSNRGDRAWLMGDAVGMWVPIRVVIIVAVGVALGAGCSDAEETPASVRERPPDEAGGGNEGRDDGAGSADRDTEVIRSYVEAMSGGDVDAAMELRCEAGRPAQERRQLFEDDLRRLTDAVGPIDVGRIEVSDTDPRLERSLQGRDAVELTYWLTIGGEEVEEPLVSVVVDEDGQRRVCTFTTAEFPQANGVLGQDLADLGDAAPPDLADLLPTSVGPGFRLVDDAAMDLSSMPGQLDGAVEGWFRIWQQETYGGVTLSAMRFGSPEEALAAAREWTRRVDDTAIEIIDVPGVAGASGVRSLGYEWLWMQPPTEGPYLDEVSMVFGDTYVTIAIGGVPTGADHEIAIAQAQEIARLANP